MFFSNLAVRVWLCVAVVIGLLVVADFERLQQEATLWQWLIKPTSGSTLFSVFLVTRGLHELGHALVLTRLGGRCPDIGVIFMLGAPCVYCDVTESWRLRSKYERAAVAAGGMYAEMIVATTAAVIWLGTAPSFIHSLALQTMIVCSVSTWLVNANPLMRFDGYYILSDWLSETNLRTRADQCSLRLVRSVLLGQTLTRQTPTRPTGLSPIREKSYVIFSLCGWAYRLSLAWVMASVIAALYAAWHFAWLGRLIAALLLTCWWGIPAMKFSTQLWASAQSTWSRMRLALLVTCILAFVCLVPLPYRVRATGWVQPKRVQGLYAPASARLIRIHKPGGAQVQPGDLVAQFDADQPKTRSIELKLVADRTQAQLTSLRAQHRRGEELSVDLRALETTSRTANAQAQHAEQLVAKYELRADMPGKLISCNATPLEGVDQHALSTSPSVWLDDHQQGRFVPAGTMLAAICSSQHMAVLPLEDEQLADVVVGTPVKLLVPSKEDLILSGQVAEVVELSQIDALGRLLSQASNTQDQSAAVTPSHTARKQTTRSAYAAIVWLTTEDLQTNATIEAVFQAPRRTLANRAVMWGRLNLRWLLP